MAVPQQRHQCAFDADPQSRQFRKPDTTIGVSYAAAGIVLDCERAVELAHDWRHYHRSLYRNRSSDCTLVHLTNDITHVRRIEFPCHCHEVTYPTSLADFKMSRDAALVGADTLDISFVLQALVNHHRQRREFGYLFEGRPVTFKRRL